MTDTNLILRGAQMRRQGSADTQGIFDNLYNRLYQQKRDQATDALAQQKMQLAAAEMQADAAKVEPDQQELALIQKQLQGQQLAPDETAFLQARDAIRQTKIAIDPTTGLARPAAQSIMPLLEKMIGASAPPAPTVKPQPTPTMLGKLESMAAPQQSAGIQLDGMPPIDESALQPDSMYGALQARANPTPAMPTPANPVQENEVFKGNVDVAKDVAKERAKADIAVETEKQKTQPKALARLNSAMNKLSIVNESVDKAIAATGKFTAGAGSYLSYIRGTPAADLKETIKTIEADAAFEALQEMRDNSPTGGALGSVATQELELLKSAQVALSTSQSPEQLRENLIAYKTARAKAARNVKKAYEQTYGSTETQDRPQSSTQRRRYNPATGAFE